MDVVGTNAVQTWVAAVPEREAGREVERTGVSGETEGRFLSVVPGGQCSIERGPQHGNMWSMTSTLVTLFRHTELYDMRDGL